MEPTGAPSAFDRQNITVSTFAAIWLTGVPVASAALKMRAPSMWTGTPRSCALIADFVDHLLRIDAPARHVVRVLDFDRAVGAQCGPTGLT